MATILKVIHPSVGDVNAEVLSRCADVARAVEIAFKYRHFFRKDVIIDLIVYRRWYVVIHAVGLLIHNDFSGATTNLMNLRSPSRSCTRRFALGSRFLPSMKLNSW